MFDGGLFGTLSSAINARATMAVLPRGKDEMTLIIHLQGLLLSYHGQSCLPIATFKLLLPNVLRNGDVAARGALQDR